jgi:hypothetical protein
MSEYKNHQDNVRVKISRILHGRWIFTQNTIDLNFEQGGKRMQTGWS